LIFDVQVEFTNVCQKEIHDRAVVHELSPRQHYLIGAFRIELLQPGTSLILRNPRALRRRTVKAMLHIDDDNKCGRS
jgi:hypothetical protein